MDKDSKEFQKYKEQLLKDKVISNNLTSKGFFNSFFKKSTMKSDKGTQKATKIENKSINSKFTLSNYISKNINNQRILSSKTTDYNSSYINKTKKKTNDYSFYPYENDIYQYLYNSKEKQSKTNCKNYDNLSIKRKNTKKNLRDKSLENSVNDFTASPRAYSKYFTSWSEAPKSSKIADKSCKALNKKNVKKKANPILKDFPASKLKEELGEILFDLSKKHDQIKIINSPNHTKYLEKIQLNEIRKVNKERAKSSKNNLPKTLKKLEINQGIKEAPSYTNKIIDHILIKPNKKCFINDNQSAGNNDNHEIEFISPTINQRFLTSNRNVNRNFPIYKQSVFRDKSSFQEIIFKIKNKSVFKTDYGQFSGAEKENNFKSYLESFNFKNNSFLEKFKNKYLSKTLVKIN